MATPLYLRASTPAYASRGFGDGFPFGYTNPDIISRIWTLALEPTRGNGVTNFNPATQAGPANILLYYLGPVEWYSRPVDQDVTISGTVTINLWSYESAMSVNSTLRVVCKRLNNFGRVVSTIFDSTWGTELGTSNAVRQWTVSPTSTTLHKGDRIWMCLVITDATGVTMGSGNVYISYNGTTGGADGDSYISFNETFGFLGGTAPSGSTLYLSNYDSDVAISTDYTELEAWTTIGDTKESSLLRPNGWGNTRSGGPYLWADDQTIWQAVEGATPSSTGYVLPGTAESIDNSSGPAWTNPNNAKTDDGSYAYVGPIPNIEWDALRLSAYDFSGAVGRVLGMAWKVRGYVAYNLGAGGTEQAVTLEGDYVNSIFEHEFPIATPSILDGSCDLFMDDRRFVSYWRDTSTRYIQTTDLSSAQGQIYYVDYIKMNIDYAPMLEWYTPPLAGFTLSGLVRFTLRALWNSVYNVANAYTMAVEVAVVDGDGSNPTVYGRLAGNAPLTTSEASYDIDIIGDDLTVTDGQRIRIRVCAGNYDRQVPWGAILPDATFYYGDTGGLCKVVFTQTLSRIVTDADTASFDLQASGSELQEAVESASAYVDVQASGTDTFEELSGYTDFDTVPTTISASGADIAIDIDAATILVDLEVSGTELHTHEYLDSSPVGVDIQADGSELQAHDYVDTDTATVDLLSSGTDEIGQVEIFTDADLVWLDIIGLGGECYSTFSGLYLLAMGDAYTRWSPGAYTDRWEGDDETRWSVVEITSTRGC